MRPEITGILLGAFIIALIKREIPADGRLCAFTRLVLGICVMVGALMFLGCPLRMLLRLGGGDLNALVALAGFAAGIGVGSLALKKGFSLRRAYAQPMLEGAAFPIASALVLLASVAMPALFLFSTEGPGSMHAPVLAALAQRSRFCMAGGLRDVYLFRDMHLLWGSIALLAVMVVGDLALGKWNLGFEG